MLKKNKKGVVETLLMYLIPIGVFLIILIFMTNFFKVASTYAKDESCRNGLMILDKVAKTVHTDTIKTIPASCKYEEVIIPYDDPKDVEREIIKLMDRCWWEMGGGKINPFARNWWVPWTESKCITCFVFKAPELREPINENKLALDLMNIEAPNGQTYHDYFNAHLIKEMGLAGESLEKLRMTKTITNDKYYSIIFLNLRTSKYREWVVDLVMDKEVEDINKLYIEELNKAQECYDDSWYVEAGELP